MLKNKLLFLAILSFAHFNLKSTEEEELTKQLVSYVINDSHDSIQGLFSYFSYLGTVYPTYINRFISVPGEIRKMPDIHRFINASDEKGKTPLHYAVEHNRINIVNMFLLQRAYINKKDMHGNTPLHYAANNDNAKMVRLLLDAGAAPYIHDNQDRKPLDFTKNNKNTEIADMLTFAEHKEVINRLFHYACKDKPDEIRAIINSFRPLYPSEINRFINVWDETGKTPLHYAVEHNRINTVKILLKQGAYINKKDKHGNTPLHYAANNGNAEMVRVLLDAGAAPDLTNDGGNTPFYFTQNNQNTEIAEMLISLIAAPLIDTTTLQPKNNFIKNARPAKVGDSSLYGLKKIMPKTTPVKL